ncbi:hypothetical protein HK100_012797 [Physocladia obscura]|uniref:Nucleotide-diphospho-sugar transferase domain-containing protein n=1 Tax=Physocladia obscura TaxID=109957 RepID=A0AAD5XCX9_9FUNG|nr:hypothetical protein HK100_012797 [Physocladia obscura]
MNSRLQSAELTMPHPSPDPLSLEPEFNTDHSSKANSNDVNSNIAYLNALAVENPLLFFVRFENTPLEVERQWFAAHSATDSNQTKRKRRADKNLSSDQDAFDKYESKPTVFLASANANVAAAPITLNMLCSLRTNAPDAFSRLIVWATDAQAASSLVSTALSFAQQRSNQNQTESVSFAVYFDATLSLPPAHANYKANNRAPFFKLMQARNAFFLRILKQLNLNLLFTDMDLVFLANPIKDLNLPKGIPSLPSLRNSGIATENNNDDKESDLDRVLADLVPVDSLYSDVPDMIYSTDTRDFFHNLNDPYERSPWIPKICGGFFFARSNPRTITTWEYMHIHNLNDQWGMDQLLNGHIATIRNSDDREPSSLAAQRRKFDAVLVDPLPAGLTSRKRDIRKFIDAQAAIRVRVLSQAAYRAALPHYADGGEVPDDYSEFLKELEERGEKEVLFHPNYNAKFLDWFVLYPFQFKYGYPSVIVSNDNKTDILIKLGKWFLNDQNTCPVFDTKTPTATLQRAT